MEKLINELKKKLYNIVYDKKSKVITFSIKNSNLKGQIYKYDNNDNKIAFQMYNELLPVILFDNEYYLLEYLDKTSFYVVEENIKEIRRQKKGATKIMLIIVILCLCFIHLKGLVEFVKMFIGNEINVKQRIFIFLILLLNSYCAIIGFLEVIKFISK